MNNKNVGEWIIMYTTGKGKDEHTQWESAHVERIAWETYRRILRQKGVNRDTVTIYKQL